MMFYLLIHLESETMFISPNDEIDEVLEYGCDTITQSSVIDELINTGYREARKHNATFSGYLEPWRVKKLIPIKKIYNDNLKAKPLTVNPVKLKYPYKNKWKL